MHSAASRPSTASPRPHLGAGGLGSRHRSPGPGLESRESTLPGRRRATRARGRNGAPLAGAVSWAGPRAAGAGQGRAGARPVSSPACAMSIGQWAPSPAGSPTRVPHEDARVGGGPDRRVCGGPQARPVGSGSDRGATPATRGEPRRPRAPTRPRDPRAPPVVRPPVPRAQPVTRPPVPRVPVPRVPPVARPPVPRALLPPPDLRRVPPALRTVKAHT